MSDTNKLSLEQIQEFAEGKRICFKESSMKLASQHADIMRENERLRSAISMLADESLSPKQRRNIIEGVRNKHSVGEKCPRCNGTGAAPEYGENSQYCSVCHGTGIYTKTSSQLEQDARNEQANRMLDVILTER